VAFPPAALRLVVKSVDGKGPYCQHETSRNIDKEDFTCVSGGSWVTLHPNCHHPHGDITEGEVHLRTGGASAVNVSEKMRYPPAAIITQLVSLGLTVGWLAGTLWIILAV